MNLINMSSITNVSPKKSLSLMTAMALLVLASAGFACASDDELISQYCGDQGGQVFTARTTGYFPDDSAMEGGFSDRIGKPLKTLQQYLAGHADYVSLAMDPKAFKYGTKVFIPKLSAYEGTQNPIEFRVVDSGGAFRGKGTSRVDICVASEHESLKDAINTTYTMIACNP